MPCYFGSSAFSLSFSQFTFVCLASGRDAVLPVAYVGLPSCHLQNAALKFNRTPASTTFKHHCFQIPPVVTDWGHCRPFFTSPRSCSPSMHTIKTQNFQYSTSWTETALVVLRKKRIAINIESNLPRVMHIYVDSFCTLYFFPYLLHAFTPVKNLS